MSAENTNAGDLWCMHIQGPDDVHAAPDFWTALAWATELNTFIVEKATTGNWKADDNYPLSQAVVRKWTGTPESHAVLCEIEISDRAEHAAKQKIAALSAQSTGSAGVAAEPVAWTYEYQSGNNWIRNLIWPDPRTALNSDCVRNIRPLYEHPPVAAAPTPPAGGGETERPASKIIAGMKDAVAFAQGDESRGRIVHPSPASPAGDLISLSAAADTVVRRVSEWDDRTSPEDWPEALLITGEELRKELITFAQENAAPAAPRKGPSNIEAILRDELELSTQAWEGDPIKIERIPEAAARIAALLTPADQGETQAVGDGWQPREEDVAAIIRSHIRLEWHGHDNADINPRSVTEAARRIHASFGGSK